MKNGLWKFWDGIARSAERMHNPNNFTERLAVRAAYAMKDAILDGRHIPDPTPELNAKLALAEELARRATA